MALARKIKALDDVAEHFRSEYKKVGDEFVLDTTGDEDISGLKSAHERVKDERNTLRDTLKAKEVEFSEYKSKVDNIPALEKSWEKRVEKAVGEVTGKVTLLTQALHKATVGAEASAIAHKHFKGPKVLQPIIEGRLTMELDEKTGASKVRVLDKEGKLSAMTIEDLTKELVEDKDLADFAIGTRASGGGPANTQPSGGGADKPNVAQAVSTALAGLKV